MKVLFIIPEYLSGRSFLQPPIDVLLSGHLFNKRGWEISLIDNRIEKLTERELIDKIEKYDPDVIVVSTSPYDVSQNYFVGFRIYVAEKTIFEIKKRFWNKPLIVVGPHGSIRPDILIRDTKCTPDIIIQWEYELILEKILSILEENKLDINASISQLMKVPNIILVKRIDGKCNWIKTRYNEDLAHPEDFPIVPELSLIKKYRVKYFGDAYKDGQYVKVRKWGILFFTRGCPFKCSFCFKFFGNTLRSPRNYKNIYETLSLWYDFGYRNIFVLDYLFGVHSQYRNLFIKLSDEFPNLRFYVQTRADLISKKFVEDINEINLGFMWLGIESFSNIIQRTINKYRNVDKIIKAINLLKKNNIPYGGFIQFGLPSETIDTINRNLYYIWKLKIPYTMSVILHTPLYGTKTYELAKEQYPWIGRNWSDISAIRGLVKNDLTPSILLSLVKFMRRREIFNRNKPPKFYG